jgi:hypothetical protein
MPTQNTWGQLIKEWISNFLTALSKKPNIILLYLLLIGSWVSNIKTCNKIDTTNSKATGAAQLAGEAKKVAENKDLEQASYEALVKSIEDLQTENDAVKERLALLRDHVQSLPTQSPPVRVFTPTGVASAPVTASARPLPIPSSIVDEPAPPPPPPWETLKSQVKK